MLRHGERSLHPLHLRDEVNGAEVTGDGGREEGSNGGRVHSSLKQVWACRRSPKYVPKHTLMRKNTSQVSERIGVHLHAIWCRQKTRWPLWVLCSHTSSNYFIKSWVPVCVCAGACVFTQPPGCNDGSRRLLFHSRQVWTYSSQRPAKPGDTLTVIANLHHGCSVSHVCSICSVQTREDTASADEELIVTALIFLNKKNVKTTLPWW